MKKIILFLLLFYLALVSGGCNQEQTVAARNIAAKDPVVVADAAVAPAPDRAKSTAVTTGPATGSATGPATAQAGGFGTTPANAPATAQAGGHAPGQAGGRSPGPAAAPYNWPGTVQASGNGGKTVPKTVYLTFDDGPVRAVTPQVLDILDLYGVKATFFVVGTNIDKNPQLLKEIVSRGHALGNHTYNHKYQEIYASKLSFLKSIIWNEEVIYRAVYMKPRVIRDPGGKLRNNAKQKSLLAASGYQLVSWDIDSFDSRFPYPSAAMITDNVRRQLDKKRHAAQIIVLMHDGLKGANTVKALPGVITMLKKEGYQFAVLQ